MNEDNEINKLLKIKSIKERKKMIQGVLTVKEQKRIDKMLKVIELAAKGLNELSISRSVGLGNSTIDSWLKKGNNALIECDEKDIESFNHQDFIYIEFFMSYYQHKEKYQQELKDNIKICGEGEYIVKDGIRVQINKPDWKASKWLLEVNDPESYIDKKEININHNNTNTVGGTILIPVFGKEISEEEKNKILFESQSNLKKEIENKG